MGELPPGVRFNPFERELIEFYLRPKVMGSQLPSDVVQERRVYGPYADPWIVFPDSDDSWIEGEFEEKCMYVFVNLTKKAADHHPVSSTKSKKKSETHNVNYERKAGCGTWHGETITKNILDAHGNDIGVRRMYKFEIKEIPQGYDESNFVVDYYKMHEYSLLEFKDTVLCKITLDPSKKASFNLPKTNQKSVVDGSNGTSGNTKGKGRKRPATKRSSSQSNNVGGSSSMVSVFGSDQQQEGALIVYSNGTMNGNSQNFNGVFGNDVGLLNSTGQLEYDYRVEEQGSDVGYLGATGYNFQSSDSDQGGIMNNCSVQSDEAGSRIQEYQEPFGDDLMAFLDNFDSTEYTDLLVEFLNYSQQQPLQDEQQTVQDNNQQQLVEDNNEQQLEDNNEQQTVEDNNEQQLVEDNNEQQLVEDNNEQQLVQVNVQRSMQTCRNLGKRNFDGQWRSKKRQKGNSLASK